MSDRMRHRSGICRFPLALTHLLFLLVFAQYCRAEVKITGVPDYQQGDFAGSNDCAPVASADILGYWDANGFPNLIDGSNDYATNPTGVTDLVNALKTNMRWTSSGTQIAWIWAGIADTAYQRGYSFSTANDGSVVWSDITTQIDAGRPAVFTMYHLSYGGMHSVGCMGYDGDGGNQVVIVHDNWYPAGDVYLNFNEISERTLTTVVPPALASYTLTVESTPGVGVAIEGEKPGTTNYAATCDDEEIVSLTAPADASFASEDYVFVRWILDSVNQTAGETTLSALMNTDRTAVAVYSLAPPSTIDDLAASLVETAASAKIAVRDAAASTNLYGVYVAANVTDDDPNTFWSSTPSSQPRAETLTLDLDSVQSVAGIRLLPRAAWPGLFPTAFTVLVSTNGTDWVQAASVSGLAPAAGAWCEREFHAQDARYLRLSIPAGGLNPIDNHYYVQIAECEVYGPAAQAVELSWTAPGGTRLEGVAASYDVRWFASAIVSDEEWAAATQLDGEPVPLGMGIGQSMTVGLADLPQEATIYFAMRSTNDGGGISELSNSPSLTTPGVPPAAVSDLAVSETDASSLTVEFTAVGDDGQVGQAAAYDLRYSTAPITDANWAAATVFDATPAPKAAGGNESITITGLADTATYYVALKVRDEAGNESDLSNVASGATTDGIAPAAVDDLSATLVEVDGASAKLDAVSAVGSTSLYGVYVGAYAIDGDPATLWSSAPSPTPRTENLLVNLGSIRSVVRVRILPRAAWLTLFPSTFFIDLSTDGANWTEVAAENGYAAQNGVWWEVAFDEAYARWVRLRVPESRLNAKDGAYYVQLTELEVYAGPQQAVQLTWTAPGDDGDQGTAASYDVRYGLQPIVDADSWNAATPVAGAPTPAPAGGAETMIIMLHGLPADARVYFAIRTTDDAANESGLSNSAAVNLPADSTPPSAIADLAASLLSVDGAALPVAAASSSTNLYGVYVAANAADGDEATLWSSSGSATPRAEWLMLDLGHTQVVGKVRLLPRPNWPQLFPASFAVEVSTDGQAWTEAVAETGFSAQPNVWYEAEFAPCNARYVRLSVPASRLNDKNGLYYVQLMEFQACEPASQVVRLTWSAPSDDTSPWRAESYSVRYAASAISSEAGWAAATPVAVGMTPGAAGSDESLVTDLLPVDGPMYFAVRSADAAANVSGLSNAAVADPPADITPPAAIADLAAAVVNASPYPKLSAAGAISSSDLYGVYVAANAIDGDEQTLWSSQPSPVPREEYLTADLGSVQTVCRVRLLPRPAWPQLFPDDFALEVSADGAAWSEAAAETGYCAQAGSWYEAVFAAVETRFVRLSIPNSRLNARDGHYYIQLMEFEVYGQPEQAVELTWTAPGDDGCVGTGAGYEVRYAAADISDEAGWEAASELSGEPAPQPGGSSESMVIPLSSLPAGCRVWFAVRTTDDAANESELSNGASVDTPAGG